MEMSVREARAHFADVIAAAERGERVTITRNGKAVAEFGPPMRGKGGLDFTRLDEVQRELRIAKPDYPLDEGWRESFDDPAWTGRIFGSDVVDDETDHSV